jgi:hypothetical protein
MLKSLVLAGAALAAAAACGVTTTHAAVAAKQTLHIVATQHDFHEIGVGKQGPKPGSVFVFSEKLVQNGKAVGSDHIVCTFVGAWPSETDFCRALFVLRGGTIVAEGSSARGPFTVAITGGTGRYASARGVVHATPTKTGELLDIALG